MPQFIVQSLLTVLVSAGVPAGLAGGVATVLTYGGTSKGCSRLAAPKGQPE